MISRSSIPRETSEQMLASQDAASVPLVSVVTPCFNGEHHLGRLLDSVLAQTYPNIEFILVNDGSTDGTATVVEFYRSRLEEKLTRFVYVVQENAGLGGALNGGLPHVSGEYLCWPDADDYLEPTSVAERVAVLEHRRDFAVVTSDAYIRNSEDIDLVAGRVSTRFKANNDPWQFEKLLRGESIFTSGCHMVRVSAFDETHPGRQIYPARRGQNWQMLLPLYFRHKRYFLDRPLYNYVVHSSSMSRGDATQQKQIDRVREHRDIRARSLSSIPMDPAERQRWDKVIEEICQRSLLGVHTKAGDARAAATIYRHFASSHRPSFHERARWQVKIAGLRIGLGPWLARRRGDSQVPSGADEECVGVRTSVLVTTYNGERFVEAQLASILDQSKKVDQVVVCDDGSTDNTVGLIQTFLAKHRLKGWSLVVNRTNLGPAANVLKNISAMDGDIVFLADQDDIWEHDKVAVMVAYMCAFPEASLVVSRTSLIGAERGESLDAGSAEANAFRGSRLHRGRTSQTQVLHFGDFIGYSTVPLHAMCVRGTVLSRIAGRGSHPELSSSLGADWYIGIWSVVLGNGLLVPEKLVRRRVHGGNISLGRLRKSTVLASTPEKRILMLREAEQAHAALLMGGDLGAELSLNQRRLVERMSAFLRRRVEFAESPSVLGALVLLVRGDLYVRSAGRLLGGARMFAADVMYALGVNWRLRGRGRHAGKG